jgi:hypothetical protein
LVKHTPEEHDKVHPDSEESARHEPVVNCVENRMLILQRSLLSIKNISFLKKNPSTF